jgi:hypothetical protein
MISRSARFRRHRTIALHCALSLIVGSHAIAQAASDSERPGSDSNSEYAIHGMPADQLEPLLHGRERSLLHPGEPLRVVGNEEDGNGFRDRTPMLAGAEGIASSVDLQELRDRRLAMYTGRERFHSPPTRQTQDSRTSAANRVRSEASKLVSEGPTGFDWGFLVGLVLLAGSAIGFLTVTLRGRP